MFAMKLCHDGLQNNHLHTKHTNTDLKYQKIQKNIVKGSFILSQIADKLIMVRPNKHMNRRYMRQVIVPLIQMCTGGLIFLVHSNILLNQIRMNDTA